MKTYTAKELAELVNGVVSGEGERTITGVNSLKMASETDISFLSTIKYKKQMDESKAAIVLVEEGMKVEPTDTRTLIFCENPDKAFTKICNLFAPEPIVYEPRICPGAYIDPTAKVAEGVFIGPNAVVMPYAEIGKGTVIGGGAYVGHYAKIGENCMINANVSIMHRCIIGNKVIIHSGTVIGADGFGYTPTFRGLVKVPQNGIVQIDNDVEIGANTTVDRATMGSTVVHKGVKLDNLIQIGHNVEIGEHTVMAAQVGVAGSTKIGSHNQIGGQVGFAGHIKIGDNNKFGAQSGVPKGIGDNKMVIGSPAINATDFAKQVVYMKKLPALFKDVENLKQLLDKKQ